MNNSENRHMRDDEIDLFELWNTIVKKKKNIFILTSIITIVGIIFAYTKTPIYEAKALIEVGNYKVLSIKNNNENVISTNSVDNPIKLVKRLNVLYIDVLKNQKDRISEVDSIIIPKGSKEFIEIKSLAISNKLAKEEIQKIIYSLKEKHGEILDNIKNNRQLEIKNIELELSNIKNKSFPLFIKKIKEEELAVSNYKLDINLLEKNIQKIKETNPTLTVLLLMEKRDLMKTVLDLEKNIFELKEKMNNSLVQNMNKLSNKKTEIESLLLSHNYKNTQIVGEIITNDYPTKPKKKLIIVVSFVTGLILSIFLAFFLEFISNRKEENKEN